MYRYRVKNKKLKISWFSFSLTILIFTNLLLQEDAFALNMRGRWIYIVDIIILCLGFVDYLSKKRVVKLRDIKESFRFLIPYVVMTVYSLLLNLIVPKMPLDEIITAGLYWIIPILVGIVIYLDMGILGIYVIYNAILLNYFMVVLKCISINGIFYLFKLSTYTNNFGSLLEVHPIGLVLPLFLIYFLFEHYQNKSSLKWNFWVGSLFTFMCGKRIALLAILAVLGIYFVLRNSSKRFEKRQLRLYMGTVFIMTFIYLVFVKYDVINLFAHAIGINTMSRLETWGALKDKYVISPFFMGNGVGFSMYYLKNLRGVYINGALNKVGDVHNDILKSYVDVGLLFFVFYMWYLFIANLKFFLKKRCVDSALLYFLLMVYTVFLMFVDNIMRYDLYLLTLFLIPMSYKKKEEKCANK